MPHIRANGINVHYEFSGRLDAPVVVLSHSLATDLDMWRPQLPDLENRYRVLRYDTRGHGATDAPLGPYTLRLLADDVVALLSALDIARACFVGISMGGMIGQTLALERPEAVSALVLCDTAASMGPGAHAVWDERIETARHAGMEAHVQPTLSRWFTPPFLAARPDETGPIADMIRATPVEGYAGCAEAIKRLDLLDRIHAIRTPTLVIVGDEDPGTTPAAARAIQERIPGAGLVVIESASHLSNIEQPEVFNRALVGFLEGIL